MLKIKPDNRCAVTSFFSEGRLFHNRDLFLTVTVPLPRNKMPPLIGFSDCSCPYKWCNMTDTDRVLTKNAGFKSPQVSNT
jgi:hypothetical protein